MRFLCVKLSTSDGGLVAYAQIPAFNIDPEVLFWGGRVFRREVEPSTDVDGYGIVTDVEVSQDVPGLEGPRRVLHYVEAWATAAIATVHADGTVSSPPVALPKIMEPRLSPAAGDVAEAILHWIEEGLELVEELDDDAIHGRDSILEPLRKARAVLADALDQKASPAWADLERLAECGRAAIRSIAPLGAEEEAVRHAKPAEVLEHLSALSDAAVRLELEKSRGRGVLPMFVSDGSSIIADSISGGADSTDGIPNDLLLLLTDAEGQERRVGYRSVRWLSSIGRHPDEAWTLREKAWVEWAERLAGRPGANISDEELRGEIENLVHWPSPSLSLLHGERTRQITEEGWDLEHDEEHSDGELAAAAACYAMPPGRRIVEGQRRKTPIGWPWDWEDWKPTPDDRVRELVKAGALILAELDRLLPLEGGR